MLGFSPIGAVPIATSASVAASGSVIGVPSGIGPVASFGTPFVPRAITCAAGGIATTLLGVPSRITPQVICAAAPIASVSVLGTPTHLSALVCTAGSFVRRTTFGRPSYKSSHYAPSAVGRRAVGTPRALTGRFVCTPASIHEGALGTPGWRGTIRCTTSAVVGSATFGKPLGGFTHFCEVGGFRSTHFGQPYVPQIVPDMSICVVRREPKLYVRAE